MSIKTRTTAKTEKETIIKPTYSNTFLELPQLMFDDDLLKEYSEDSLLEIRHEVEDYKKSALIEKRRKLKLKVDDTAEIGRLLISFDDAVNIKRYIPTYPTKRFPDIVDISIEKHNSTLTFYNILGSPYEIKKKVDDYIESEIEDFVDFDSFEDMNIGDVIAVEKPKIVKNKKQIK